MPAIFPGRIDLPNAQSHHVRDVLRLKPGDLLELFDDAGNVAVGEIAQVTSAGVAVLVNHVAAATTEHFQLTIASAIPKGTRADWLIEKLSELGVGRFIPLETDRSVTLPRGPGKTGRWARLAEEAARQSRRAGVMKIDELTLLRDLLARVAEREFERACHLSTEPRSPTLFGALEKLPRSLLLLIGPEGGWTIQEQSRFNDLRIGGCRLTRSILRIETAAITAAAIVLSMQSEAPPSN